MLQRCMQIKTHAWSNAVVALVGNKCDLEELRVVPTSRSKKLAHELGMHVPRFVFMASCYSWHWLTFRLYHTGYEIHGKFIKYLLMSCDCMKFMENVFIIF